MWCLKKQALLWLHKTRTQGHTVLNCCPLPVHPIQFQVHCARSHVCVRVLQSNGQMRRHIRHTETASLGKPSSREDYRRIYLIWQTLFPQVGVPNTRTHTPACTLTKQIRLEPTTMMDVPMARVQPGSWLIKAPDLRFKLNANSAIRRRKITTMRSWITSIKCKQGRSQNCKAFQTYRKNLTF